MSINREEILRSFLKEKFDEITTENFYEAAPSTTVYPFLTYLLEDSFDDGLIEVFNLVIDGWDDNSDTTNLVRLMSDVDNLFQRLKGSADGLFFSFYRSNRRTLTDPDKRLRRRQLEFEVKVMGGNR